MILLRAAVLTIAFAFAIAPAAGTRRRSAGGLRIPFTRAECVQAALEQATESGDPIEKIVLDGSEARTRRATSTCFWLRRAQIHAQITELRSSMDRADNYASEPLRTDARISRSSYSDDPAALAAWLTSSSAARLRASSPTSLPAASSRPTSASSFTLEPERPDLERRSLAVAVDRGGRRSREFSSPSTGIPGAEIGACQARALRGEEQVQVPEGKI